MTENPQHFLVDAPRKLDPLLGRLIDDPALGLNDEDRDTVERLRHTLASIVDVDLSIPLLERAAITTCRDVVAQAHTILGRYHPPTS